MPSRRRYRTSRVCLRIFFSYAYRVQIYVTTVRYLIYNEYTRYIDLYTYSHTHTHITHSLAHVLTYVHTRTDHSSVRVCVHTQSRVSLRFINFIYAQLVLPVYFISFFPSTRNSLFNFFIQLFYYCIVIMSDKYFGGIEG